jgi:hypothetical protein
MKPTAEVVPNRNAVETRWAHFETLQRGSERLRHSMRVPLFFSELAPSGYLGRKGGDVQDAKRPSASQVSSHRSAGSAFDNPRTVLTRTSFVLSPYGS